MEQKEVLVSLGELLEMVGDYPLCVKEIHAIPEYPKEQGYTIEDFVRFSKRNVTFCEVRDSGGFVRFILPRYLFPVDMESIIFVKALFNKAFEEISAKVEFDYRAVATITRINH